MLRAITVLTIRVFAIGAISIAAMQLSWAVPPTIENLPLYEWQAISQNTLSDVDPCPSRDCAWSGVEGQSAIINDWTGGAYASGVGTFGSLIYFGGGHNSYYGNEVYAFDFETLRWQRRNNPTDGQTPGNAASMAMDSTCRFWDGAVTSQHTYDMVNYDPISNSFFSLTPGDAASSFAPGRAGGCGNTTPAFFSFATNQWGNKNGAGPTSLTNGPTAYDPNRRLFWGRTGYRNPRLFVSYNPATDQWAQYPDVPIDIDSVGAIDPTRDLFVAAAFRGASPLVAVRDLSQPAEPRVIVSRGGDTQVEGQGPGIGFEWAPRLGAFIAWNRGRDLYLLKPPSGNWRTETWTWTRYAANGADPGSVSNGPYSKFQWLDSLGIAVIAPRINGPVYAVRMIAGSGAPPPPPTDTIRPSSPTSLLSD